MVAMIPKAIVAMVLASMPSVVTKSVALAMWKEEMLDKAGRRVILLKPYDCGAVCFTYARGWDVHIAYADDIGGGRVRVVEKTQEHGEETL